MSISKILSPPSRALALPSLARARSITGVSSAALVNDGYTGAVSMETHWRRRG